MHILRAIWAGYAVALFLVMMFLSLPILALNMIITPGNRALRSNIHFLYHIFTPVFLTLIGVRLEVLGLEQLDRKRTAIIVSNHRSAIDFIVNAHAYPGVFRFLAKQELIKIPVFGWVVSKMCLTVDRTNAKSRAQSMVALRHALDNGWSIFIYPEGGRNRTSEPLAPFYDGAFRLAVQCGAPIAVQVIKNIENITATTQSVDLKPGTLLIKWHAYIETTGLTNDDIPMLKEKVRAIMMRELGVES